MDNRLTKKKLAKLVGISDEQFKEFVALKQITYQKARLIPLLKTGDEMALTSILLSGMRLIKEFRQSVLKELGMPRSGRYHYLTEVCFPGYSKERFDGMIVVIKSGKISDVTIFEMKKGNDTIKPAQMESYQNLALQLRIPRIVTISNQFVSDSVHVPFNIKRTKRVDFYHFSWTYILTIARILLFNNQTNIDDPDQVEIMKEILHYFEGDKSGVQALLKMPTEWKELTEAIRSHRPVSVKGNIEREAILGWYQMEKHLALNLSQKLGVLVGTKSRDEKSLKADIAFVGKQNSIKSRLNIKHAVSDILIDADFEKRNIKETVAIEVPETGSNTTKMNFIIRQLEKARKKNTETFEKLMGSTFVTANIKYARVPETVKLENIEHLKNLKKTDEIKSIELYTICDLGSRFVSGKGFLSSIDELTMDFYEGYIQHLSNWMKPAPKLESKDAIQVSSGDEKRSDIGLE